MHRLVLVGQALLPQPSDGGEADNAGFSTTAQFHRKPVQESSQHKATTVKPSP